MDALVTEMIKCMEKPFAFYGSGFGYRVRHPSPVDASLSVPLFLIVKVSSFVARLLGGFVAMSMEDFFV